MTSPVSLAWMGFDPRHGWTPHRGRPITANVDALLAENEALRQQVWSLRQQLERLRSERASRVSASAAPSLTGERVDRWCQAMARHPAWAALRVGPPGGLRALVEELRRHCWDPSLTLEEELDRQIPGLGRELSAALRGPHSRGRWAVRAAFALYGPRAVEWLSEEPLRVVEALAQRLERLDRLDRRQDQRQEPGQGNRQGQGKRQAPGQDRWEGQGERQGRDRGQWQGQEPGPGRRRGTRTANHSQAPGHSSSKESATAAGTGSGPGPESGSGPVPGSGPGQGSGKGTRPGAETGSDARGSGGNPRGSGASSAEPALDPRRQEALHLLGLEPGASPRAIKQAYWRLAKAHHPDRGGDPEAFHRLEAAHRLLVG